MASGLFSIARSALLTHQTALQTVAHNIANAETPGFSRQKAELKAGIPNRMTYGNIGTGVMLDSISRNRDILADQSYRAANGAFGESGMRRDLLTGIESIFGEPADAGMAATLDQFWSSFSDLSTLPSSGAAKAVVQQRGRQLSEMFNTYDASLTQSRDQASLRLNNTIGQVNQIAGQVADLNGRILTAEAGGNEASDLRDQRDRYIDQLSTMVGARSEPQRDGSVSVIVGNSTLVNGSSARPLKIVADPPTPPPAITPADMPFKITLGNSPDRLAPLGGEVKAMLDVINTEVPTMRSRLDALASSIVSSVNAVHNTGYVFNGNTIPGAAAGDFFNAGAPLDPVRASNFRLADAIAADPGNIAVSTDPLAPLDNNVALNLAALRNSTDSVSFVGPQGQTETAGFLSFFRTTVTGLGLSVRAATDDASVYGILTDQADTRRQSVSGVSTDEELVQMMRIQQSYSAATKLIQTADEMLQTLLDLV